MRMLPSITKRKDKNGLIALGIKEQCKIVCNAAEYTDLHGGLLN